MVESVRVGTIIAHDRQAASRWQSQARPRRERGLAGADLEQAIANMASMFPGHVTHGVGRERGDGHLEAMI